MICKHCGQELPQGLVFCSSCGKHLVETDDPTGGMPPLIPDSNLPPAATDTEAAPAAEETQAQAKAPEISDQPAASKKPLLTGVLKDKKKLLIGIGALVVLIGVIVLTVCLCVNANTYKNAQQQRQDGQYEKAIQLFRSLGGYKDAAQRADDLERWQAEYDRAVGLMAQRQYDQAREVFQSLARNNYRDSREMADTGIHYEKANYLVSSAAAGDTEALKTQLSPEDIHQGQEVLQLYELAAETYLQLGQYKDAPQKLQECYTAMAALSLEQGRHQDALKQMDKMDEATRKAFEETFRAACADTRALEALCGALEQNRTNPENKTKRQLLEQELEALKPFTEEYFYDEALREQFIAYVSYLEAQFSNIEDNNLTDWLKNVARGYEVLEQLSAEFDIFAQHPELKSHYENSAKRQWALVEIEPVIRSQLIGRAPQYATGAGYYLVFTNELKYEFTLDLQLTFYVGDLKVDQREMLDVKIAPETYTTLWLNAPLDPVRWDIMDITWTVGEILLEGQSIG